MKNKPVTYTPSLPGHNDNVSHDRPVREFILLFSGISLFLFSAFWILGLFIDQAVNYISPKMEAVIFSSFNPTAAERLDDSDPKRIELQRMVDALCRCADISYPLSVHMIASNDANALAFPGGRIIVLNGLLNKIESENGLCFVLAHELAHFQNRDHLRGMGRGIVFTALAALITGADSDFTQLFAPAANLSQAGYSRKREQLADQKALEILNCYYGHVGGATEFFKAMTPDKKKKNLLQAHYFDSHPEAVERINRLHQLTGELKYPVKNVRPLPRVLVTD